MAAVAAAEEPVVQTTQINKMDMVVLVSQIMQEFQHHFQEQEVVMVMKTSVVEAVVDQTILHMKQAETVVPVSFSSHILHKYSKNRKWA
jgi:hypothetical protein